MCLAMAAGGVTPRCSRPYSMPLRQQGTRGTGKSLASFMPISCSAMGRTGQTMSIMMTSLGWFLLVSVPINSLESRIILTRRVRTMTPCTTVPTSALARLSGSKARRTSLPRTPASTARLPWRHAIWQRPRATRPTMARLCPSIRPSANCCSMPPTDKSMTAVHGHPTAPWRRISTIGHPLITRAPCSAQLFCFMSIRAIPNTCQMLTRYTTIPFPTCATATVL